MTPSASSRKSAAGSGRPAAESVAATLAVRGIDKWFGATHAVRDVSFAAAPGGVLGLVGENGAGKSTVIKIIGGVIAPDHGEVRLGDVPLRLKNPREALAHGIAAVFQELALIDNLSVAENLLLLDPPRHRWRGIDRRRFHDRAAEILERYRLGVTPAARLGDLPLGQRQMLEIVRAASRDPSVLILDEATSALGQGEVEWLIRLVRLLSEARKIVLFISHRWEEISSFCDRVAVMRNGQLIELAESRSLSQERAVQLMTGHAMEGSFPAKGKARGAPLLQAQNLAGAVLKDVSFSLAEGEVLGLGGLVGQGQSELLRTLFGARELGAGSILLRGRKLHGGGPREVIKAGIAYVPQERKSEGLFLDKDVAFNMTFAVLGQLATTFGLVRRQRERSIVGEAIERLSIKTPGAGTRIKALSGGNQQKVLLQKWLLTNPAVLLLDDVTRGVDIGTKQQIYAIIRATAAAGTGIILYSTDTAELVGLADRVLVMVEGRIRTCLEGAAISARAIVAAAIGQEAGP
ncbi:MAG: sugar ABC transporter ATP-binding protein [Acetobacteraceae bacterium]